MKLILFFLFLPFAFALFSGETETINYDLECNDYITVRVSGEIRIDDYEYSLDCENVSQDYWRCNCTGELNISTGLNTVNNYTLLMISDIEDVAPIVYTTGSGGYSGGGYFRPKVNDTNVTEEVVEVEEEEVEEVVEETKGGVEIAEEEEEPLIIVEEEEEFPIWIWWVLGGMVLVVGVLIIYYKYY